MTDQVNGGRGTVKAAFAAVTTLFFAWGFITSLIDPLVAAVKGIFTLSDTQAQLSAFAFFIAYGVVSFPAAALIARLRAVPAILLALGMMAAACLIMLGAANIANYSLVLVGLFVLASGITVLQVAANPLAAALGKPEGSHFRLTLSQTFNSFGTFLGPWLGAMLFLRGVEVKGGVALTPEVRDAALAGIDRAYFWICGLILALIVFFWLSRKTVAGAAPAPNHAAANEVGALLRRAFTAPLGIVACVGLAATILGARVGVLSGSVAILLGAASTLLLLDVLGRATGSSWARFGAFAIFLYVGAEVAIGTQMALFLNGDAVWGVSLQDAAKYVSIYWGGAFVGRLIGTALLAFLPASRLLAVFTAIAAAMCLYIVGAGGVSAGYVALAIGLFNSIMFPVIFTLTLERSTASEEATSGLLCTAIVGGAFLPLLVGMVSDKVGYSTALVVPAACYALLCLFALKAASAPVRRTASVAAGH